MNQAPGAIALTGSVTDDSGVSGLTVNGAPVTVDASGTFAAPIDAVWGINLVTLAAIDEAGNEARDTCAFLLSGTWAPDNAPLSSTVSLRAAQSAFDDGNRVDSLDSFADILHTVINSNGLRNALHTGLIAANPLKPGACDQTVLGVCVLRSQVRYLNLAVDGPNSTSLALVTGGLSNSAIASDVRVQVRVDGHVAGIPYDTTGWITFAWGTVGSVFDTALSQGQPRVTIRPGSVTASMGAISTDFSGLDGAIINIVVDLFNGAVRDMVRNLVRDFVTSEFDEVLDSIFQGLHINNVASTFNVPRLDGAGSVAVDFAPSYSTLATSSNRMLTTIGTRFSTTPAHDRPTLGAPIPAGTRSLDVTTSSPIANALHIGLINQALHAVWLGGYFDGTLEGGALGAVIRPGVTLEMVMGLPPAARLLDGDRMEIAVGAVSARLTDTSLSPDPIDLKLGGRASCAMSLANDDLLVDGCTVDELTLSTGDAALDSQAQIDLELFVTDVLNQVAASALNDSIPALPIPAFELPQSLAPYGLPVGEELGIVSPVLRTVGDHVVLEGAFGVR